MSDALQDIRAALAPYIEQPELDRRTIKRVAEPKSKRERDKSHRAKKRVERLTQIAVLDFETDPFDPRTRETIFPFVCCIHSDDFDPIVIWNDDRRAFINEVVAAIEGLPGEYTIYAHNGGNFDWQFLLHRIRGEVSFKGRSIMAARIGRHSLRDSFHIIPEKLASYRKDAFDYTKLRRDRRAKYREEIISYLKSDCVYLLQIVKAFVAEHGLKLSIGQAAMAALKNAGYKVASLGENMDAYLRHYFFGGRVECLEGKGEFVGPFKLYDVNSMYPFAMANYKHPIGRDYIIRAGEPGPYTVFLDLECENYGALVKRTEDGETSAVNGYGRFQTTIWEYEVARKFGLIDRVKITWCIDCLDRSDFSAFVTPLYEKRQLTKRELARLKATGETETAHFYDVKKDDLFYKLILNNAYGKFAQNPRRFKESTITDIGVRPEHEPETWGPLPVIENEEFGYAIFERPQKTLRFNNVGTAASITGAARAILLEAICNAIRPIYCDTDSLVCLELPNTELDGEALGAWDLEDSYSAVLVAGKKLYACDRGDDKPSDKRYKVRSKGIAGMTWQDMEAILDDEIGELLKTNPAPTLSRGGKQAYVTRRVRATARTANVQLRNRLDQRNAANG